MTENKKVKFLEFYTNGATSKKLAIYIRDNWAEYKAWSYKHWEDKKL